MITRTHRIAVDYGQSPVPGELRIEGWQAVALNIAVGIFKNGDIDDGANITGVELEVRTSRSAATNLIYKLTATIDTTVTVADWLAGLDEHAVLELTAAQMNVPMASDTAQSRTLFCCLKATRASGGSIVLGEGTFKLHRTTETADPPDDNPGQGITQDAADARYVRGRIATQDGITGLIIVDENGADAGFVPMTALS